MASRIDCQVKCFRDSWVLWIAIGPLNNLFAEVVRHCAKSTDRCPFLLTGSFLSGRQEYGSVNTLRGKRRLIVVLFSYCFWGRCHRSSAPPVISICILLIQRTVATNAPINNRF